MIDACHSQRVWCREPHYPIHHSAIRNRHSAMREKQISTAEMSARSSDFIRLDNAVVQWERSSAIFAFLLVAVLLLTLRFLSCSSFSIVHIQVVQGIFRTFHLLLFRRIETSFLLRCNWWIFTISNPVRWTGTQVYEVLMVSTLAALPDLLHAYLSSNTVNCRL